MKQLRLLSYILICLDGKTESELGDMLALLRANSADKLLPKNKKLLKRYYSELIQIYSGLIEKTQEWIDFEKEFNLKI